MLSAIFSILDWRLFIIEKLLYGSAKMWPSLTLWISLLNVQSDIISDVHRNFYSLLFFLPTLLYKETTNFFGRRRINIELALASVPGTMIILRCKVFRTAISPTLAGDTAIFTPNHPSFSLVSFITEGFVNTGPGAKQLTLMFSSLNWYLKE